MDLSDNYACSRDGVGHIRPQTLGLLRDSISCYLVDLSCFESVYGRV